MRSRVCRAGIYTSLSQQLLKLTAPGVPDIYQGTELWDFSLVDPDNRRQVDYQTRVRLLRALARRNPTPRLAADLIASAADGRIKLFVTARVLAFRLQYPELFARGSYQPLNTDGDKSDYAFVFARMLGEQEIVVVAPRLVDSLLRGDAIAPVGSAVWGETAVHLPESDDGATYRNLFTGGQIAATAGTLSVAEALADFPVAVLIRDR
jgi:(1->4)-alpha-D-glucan 1-alpha-D-glucosylmutase